MYRHIQGKRSSLPSRPLHPPSTATSSTSIVKPIQYSTLQIICPVQAPTIPSTNAVHYSRVRPPTSDMPATTFAQWASHAPTMELHEYGTKHTYPPASMYFQTNYDTSQRLAVSRSPPRELLHQVILIQRGPEVHWIFYKQAETYSLGHIITKS